MGFYSLDYEFFKGGKDRTRRSFNPDFFIYIKLDDYIEKLSSERPTDPLRSLVKLQDSGIKAIVRAVEIKSDENKEEVTRAKEKYGKEHFTSVNKRLGETNPIDLPTDFQDSTFQYYTFDLLTPEAYSLWFSNLRIGNIAVALQSPPTPAGQ